MKILPKFPPYASGNCDITNKRTKVEGDERVVALDVEVERLPVGMACLHSDTVKMMVAKLGWKLQTNEDVAELNEARRELAEALERLAAYENLANALERVFEAETPKLEVVS